MGHYQDFLESLLGDNVIRECEKIIHEMRTHESQSKLANRDWHHRQEHCKRAQQIKQQQIMRTFRNSRTRIK